LFHEFFKFLNSSVDPLSGTKWNSLTYYLVCRITKDLLHDEPTTLLFSIEGMPNLDWKRLLKLQCSDGSFVSSPAPTAYALMQTGDKKCLEFLDGVVNKFNGGGKGFSAYIFLLLECHVTHQQFAH
jgi:hypothetical protein